MARTLKSLKTKFDGFRNLLNGIGDRNKDPIKNFKFYSSARLDETTIDDIYRSSAITRKIINTLPNDMTRKVIDIDHEKANLLLSKVKQVYPLINEGLKQANAHGGALLVFNIVDGRDPMEPVDWSRVTDVQPLFVINKWYVDPLIRDENGGLVHYRSYHPVEAYRIQTSEKHKVIHKDRVMVFQGHYAGEQNRLDNNGWQESQIDILLDEITSYEVVFNAAGTLAQDISVGVFSLDGLNDVLKLGCEGEETVLTKLKTIQASKSFVNAMIMDSADSYRRDNGNISGYKDLKDAVKQRLSAASQMPHTKLFGESPSASLGSQSGLSEARDWYDNVQASQETELRPQLDKFINWCKALLNIPFDEIINYVFPSLFQLDEKTFSEVRKNQAQTDEIYFGLGLSADEILDSRFGSGQWSPQTTLDADSRDTMNSLPTPVDTE